MANVNDVKGLFIARGLVLVGINKVDFKDGGYYTCLTFTTSDFKDVFSVNCGKESPFEKNFVGGSKFDVGFNYVGGKLKIADMVKIS